MQKKRQILILAIVLFFIGSGILLYQNVRATIAPPLKEGTYLSGQTLSVWPSWSLLGSAVGQGLPTDPINRLGRAGTCASSTNKFCLADTDCPSSMTFSATGGTISYSGGYTIHTFTAAGTYTFTPNGAGSIEVLVVAGGGGGGSRMGGGGGGGGVCYQASRSVTNAAYTVTIGDGGARGTGAKASSVGTNGNASIFDTITANGGGGGGSYRIAVGKNGGSGGGGSSGQAAGNATQGNSGGATCYGNNGGAVSGGYNGGGGGGAGSVGGLGSGSAGGAGGTGYSFLGTTYGGGGGGASDFSPSASGNDGGGNSGYGNDMNGFDASANRGGGGGGTRNGTDAPNVNDPSIIVGGNGGSGIVIVRYLPPPATATTYEHCVLHDPATGWSVADRRFSFACASTSYAYRYIFSTSTGQYTVRANFENTGLTITNQDAFIKSFVSTTRFIINSPTGICSQDQEISTISQGYCGDGKVNLNMGEECDPPQAKVYDYSHCKPDGKGSVVVNICDGNCHWQQPPDTASCIDKKKCGNGRFDLGELCDDGALNGTYGHCNSDCQGRGAAGFCGDNKLQSKYESCDTVNGTCQFAPGKNVTKMSTKSPTASSPQTRLQIVQLVQPCLPYSFFSAYACRWDCSGVGSYCGDGVVNEQFGEECENDENCIIGGVPGKRYCTSCKPDYSRVANLISFWNFDSIENGVIKNSVSSIKNGTCDAATCPAVVEGSTQYKKGFNFAGGKGVKINDAGNSDFIIPKFSIEAWIKPSSAGNPPRARILEKGGWKPIPPGVFNIEGGFSIFFNFSPSGDCKDEVFAVPPCNDSAANSYRCLTWDTYTYYAADTNSMSLNDWHHIACVFDSSIVDGDGAYRGDLKTYLDGNLVSTRHDARMMKTDFPLCIGDECVKSGGSYDLQRSRTFNGVIQDLGIYDIALSDATIKSHFDSKNQFLGWYCSATQAAGTPSAAPGTCGDGHVDESEACDNGLANNGLACTPTPPSTLLPNGRSCSYCSADCKNVITVEPKP